MVCVSIKVLIWARERAGYTPEQAAKKAGISQRNFQKIERGEKNPTDRQVSKLAHLYGCPMIAFFLPNPPPESKTEKEFRKQIGKSALPEEQGYLRRLITNVQARQIIVRSLREDDEDGEPSPVSIVGKLGDRTRYDVKETAAFISRDIKFDLDVYRSRRTFASAFNYLRDKIQDVGIFVILAKNCGSYHSNIRPAIFKAMSLCDEIAPFIVINNGGAQPSLAFTLLRELAHIVLNQSHLSASLQRNSKKIEKFCDEVAAGILLSKKDRNALSHVSVDDVDGCREELTYLSVAWKVSGSMLAYHLRKERRISALFYSKLCNDFKMAWDTERRRIRARDGGSSSNALIRNYIGKKLLDLTKRGLQAGYIRPTQAAKIFGIQNAQRVYKVLA